MYRLLNGRTVAQGTDEAKADKAMRRLRNAVGEIRALSRVPCLRGDGRRCKCASCRARIWLRAIEDSE